MSTCNGWRSHRKSATRWWPAPINVFATEERRHVALMLVRGGADLVGICPDRVFPSPRGLEFGVGAFCAMFAHACNITPIFCGKPQEVFFRKLCERLAVQPSRCVLIGDNLESDIAGGRQVGMHTILTLSGVTAEQDLRDLPDDRRPDAVVRGLPDLL